MLTRPRLEPNQVVALDEESAGECRSPDYLRRIRRRRSKSFTGPRDLPRVRFDGARFGADDDRLRVGFAVIPSGKAREYTMAKRPIVRVRAT